MLTLNNQPLAIFSLCYSTFLLTLDMLFPKGVRLTYLKISQNSQDNSCQGSFLIKLLACSLNQWKETRTQVFTCEFNEIFKGSLFTEHLEAYVSGSIKKMTPKISVTMKTGQPEYLRYNSYRICFCLEVLTEFLVSSNSS